MRQTLPRLLVAALAALSACGAAIDQGLDAEADTAGAERGADSQTLEELAVRSVDPDPARAEDAIARLRAAGPSGHRALLDAHQSALATLRTSPPIGAPPPEIERLRHAIDVVSGQRDGHASLLYWFTDLDLARATRDRWQVHLHRYQMSPYARRK